MLEKKRTAILFTANTPHLAHANLMIDSLFDKSKGHFEGDLWVISTGLSERAKNFCDSRGIKYLINQLGSLYEWKNWKLIAMAQPEYKTIKEENEEERLVKAFEIYRNKRMSKLIILDWIEKFGKNYDFIALGDNDLYFQKNIHDLFAKVYEEAPDQISYWQEENEIVPGSWLWKKDFHYSVLYDVTDMDFGEHEINIGFILGKPDRLKELFRQVKKDFYELRLELFIKYSWHDQDLVRLERAKNPSMFYLLDKGFIVHLCNGGNAVIDERIPKYFYHKETEQQPYIIHFAGGSWKAYQSIKDTYLVDSESYYFINETGKEFDEIRKNALFDVINLNNPEFYTKLNEESKIKNRNRWLEIADNGKKNVLLMGWLEITTHKSFVNYLQPFLDSDLFNLAIVNGNITEEAYDNIIWEDFPKRFAALTGMITDANIVRLFGYQITSLPEWVLADGIKALEEEYGCQKRNARAVANLLVLYFSKVLDFYKPDIVIYISITNALGKLMQNICKWKKIPISDLEWGVLPGTISFEISGHMAESWVSKESQYFNSLKLTHDDIVQAENYLRIASSDELSRNNVVGTKKGLIEEILLLKSEGYKIILYMESNSACSGNTYADEQRARLHSPLFKDDCDAYEYLAGICKKHETWRIIYKPHPIAITRGLKTQIDESCTVIMREGTLNDIFSLADVSVTLVSQSAYLSMFQNVPVLLLGKIQLNDSGAAYSIKTLLEIEDKICYAMKYGITEKQKRMFVEHVARLLKYYLFSYDERISKRGIGSMAECYNDILNGRNKEHYKYERLAYISQIKCKTISKNRNPIVSVVIPVHNSSEYLSECLASICSQSLYDIEIICVNNGSIDNSQKILEYYAKRDSRIILIEQEESISAGSPRNTGMRVAVGKYVYLMDSDDYIESNALEVLVDIAENKQSDLIYFFYKQVEDRINRVLARPRFYSFIKFFPEEKVFKLENEYYKFFIQYPFPWGKLISRKLLVENNLYFDSNVRCFEDNPHNLKILLSAQNPYVCNERLYYLRMHQDSSTHHVNSAIAGMTDAVKRMNEIYIEKGVYEKFQRYYVPYKIHILGWAWTMVPEELRREYFNEVSQLFTVGDKKYFIYDEIWSIFEIPSRNSVNLIRDMLSMNYEEYMETKYSAQSSKVHNELQPWERISKTHLIAIKICEKFHLIKFAIKMKALLTKA